MIWGDHNERVLAERDPNPPEEDPGPCVAYDRHENGPNECCGCHYECQEYPDHPVHVDPTNPKFHEFYSYEQRKADKEKT